MSSPPLKTPVAVRWLSALIVVAALIVRFAPQWLHLPAPGASDSTRNAALSAPGPAAGSPAETPAPGAFGAAVGFRSATRLEEHFRKHGREFDAPLCRRIPASGAGAAGPARGRRRCSSTYAADGVVTRFDRASGAFIAFGADGVIRTFFRPNDGERYFERQATRPRGAP